MKQPMHRLVLLTLFLAAAPLAASAADKAAADKAGGIAVEHVWARPSLAGTRTGAAYFTVTNHGAAPDTLVAVSTPVAAKAAVHEETMEQGVMRMRPLGALPLAPGATLKLAPGGEHVMLMGLKAPLKPGEHFPLTLTFAKAGAVTVTGTVEGGAAAHHHHGS